MTLPVKATPATGVLEGHEAGVLELTLGVQPPPPPPPVEALPPHPVKMAKKGAAKKTEMESERRKRGSFNVGFPILQFAGLRTNACGCAKPAGSPLKRPRHLQAPARGLDLPASQRIRFARGAEAQQRPTSRPGEKRSGESFESPLLHPRVGSANPGLPWQTVYGDQFQNTRKIATGGYASKG